MLALYAACMQSSADVIVVGGGIIGCSTAAELAAAGADVLLVEGAEIGHGASGRNHGLIFYPQNLLTDPLYRASHRMYRELAGSSRLNFSLDEEPRGFLILVSEEEQWEPARREAECCKEGGVRVERLTARELKAVEPHVADDLLGAWLIHDGYRLDPAALTLAYALEAEHRGARVVTHTEVKQVLRARGRVSGVATDRGIVVAPTVVLAAGPWAPKLARSAGVDLPMSGARGWLMLTSAQPRLFDHLLESSGWHLMSGDPGPHDVTVESYGQEAPNPAQIGLLVQQNRTGHVLLGGSRITSLQREAEGQEVTREIARRAARAVPRLAGVPIREVWSGVRPSTRDGLPVLGWAPEVPGLFVAGGHGGQGVMLGAGSGRLAAQLVTGAEPFMDPAPFAADRRSLRP